VDERSEAVVEMNPLGLCNRSEYEAAAKGLVTER
jgi:hypothetical protein